MNEKIKAKDGIFHVPKGHEIVGHCEGWPITLPIKRRKDEGLGYLLMTFGFLFGGLYFVGLLIGWYTKYCL